MALAAMRLPELLDRTAAQLHRVDPTPLRRSLAGLDGGVVVDVGSLIGRLGSEP